MPLAPEVLALAQQGNPQVLAAVINHAMRTYGVRAQVMRRDSNLHILLEASQAPQEASAVAFVESLLRTLGVAAVESVLVYGYQTGEKQVAWQRSIALQAATPQSSTGEVASRQAEAPHAAQPSAEAQAEAQAEVQATVGDDAAPLRRSAEAIATLPDREPEDLSLSSPPTSVAESLEELDFINPFVLSPDDPIVEPALPEEEFVKLVKAEVVEEKDAPTLVPQELAQHPESVVLLVMVSLFVIWKFYLELLAEPENALTTGQLAQRLGVKRKLVRHQKYQPNFTEWSRSLDPDGVGWQWQEGRFRPVVSSL